MRQVHTDAATVEFRSPDGKKQIYVLPGQVFAVTELENGTAYLIGPQNAAIFVDGTVKDARDRVVAALTHATKTPGGQVGI